MSIRIGVANYAGFYQFLEKLQPELPADVELVVLNDLFSELEKSVRRIEAEGSVDIFVASGGNADYLRRYLKTIPLVDVKVTGFDILNAVCEASAYSSNIAVITPFSTGGAMTMAGETDENKKNKLFVSLMILSVGSILFASLLTVLGVLS